MKILIVEDDPVVRAMIKRVIAAPNRQLLEAGNGLEGLDGVERDDPDIVITDLRMPVLDGFELIDALRRSPTHAKLPVVCLTWLNDRADVARIAELGVVEYVLKPVNRRFADRLNRIIATHGHWRDECPKRGWSLGGGSVLVVDADADFRAFAARELAGASVAQAASASEAMEHVRDAETKPAMIVVSERLPLVPAHRLAAGAQHVVTNSGHLAPIFLLLRDVGESSDVDDPIWSGVVHRSLEPGVFAAAVRGSEESNLVEASAAVD